MLKILEYKNATSVLLFLLKDINECTIMQDICNNGECHNTFGSFRCKCNLGWKGKRKITYTFIHMVTYTGAAKSVFKIERSIF